MFPVQPETIKWHQPPETLLQLAERMNVAVKNFGIAQDFFNAFTDGE